MLASKRNATALKGRNKGNFYLIVTLSSSSISHFTKFFFNFICLTCLLLHITFNNNNAVATTKLLVVFNFNKLCRLMVLSYINNLCSPVFHRQWVIP